MKLFKRFSALNAALMALVVMALSSCSSKDPVEVVPDDVDFVASVNFQRLLDQTNVKITEDDIEFPDELTMLDHSMPNEAKEILARVNKSVDLSQVLCFGYVKFNKNSRYEVPGDFYMVAKVKDDKELEKILVDEADLDKEEEEGFDVYSMKDRAFVLIKDDLLWLAMSQEMEDVEDAAKNVKKVLEKADKKNISEVAGVAGNLNNGIISVNINSSQIISMLKMFSGELPTEQAVMATAVLEKFKGSWINYTGDIAGKKVSLTAKCYNPSNGNVVNLGLTKPVDTQLLTYFPSDILSVAALEVAPDQLNSLCDMLKRLADDEYNTHINNSYYDDYYRNSIEQEHQVMLQAIDVIRSIDGTVMAGVGTTDLQSFIFGGDTRNTKFIIAAQMKSGFSMSKLQSLLTAFSGDTVSASGNSELIMPLDRDLTLHFKLAGNNLIISNFTANAGNSSNFTQLVTGSEIIIAAKIPSLAPITDNMCNFGAETMLRYAGGELKLEFDLTNCSKSLVEAIMDLGQGYERASRRYWNSRNNEGIADRIKPGTSEHKQ